MKEDIKDLWIEALRSEKYKQGQTQLRNKEDHFCCLGVLCDISGLGTWHNDNDVFLYILEGNYLRHAIHLPPDVRDWAGMSSCYGTLPTHVRSYGSLEVLNDSNMSFSQIADVIEKQWKEL